MPDLPSADGLRAIVVLGVGGSAVAGEILRAIGADQLRMPVVLVGDYVVPAFVGPSTLVFAVSFSGQTEETLAATEAALTRQARLIVVTGGGRLAEIAASNGAPVFPTPAAYSTAPSRRCCHRRAPVGRLRTSRPPAWHLGRHRVRGQPARKRRDSLADGGGLALEIAERLDRTIPLVQGAEGIGAVAARRWKTQVNENAKAPAFFSTQPEWCHNEICGFGQNGDVTRQVMTIVALESSYENPRIEQRFGLVDELVGEAVASTIEVRADGSGPLAQLFDLIMIGDFVSLHLAAREGIDPGPVPVLVEVKRRLSATRE